MSETKGAGRSAGGMPSGTLLPLVFEVVDPGEDAVAFEFAFREISDGA